MEQTSNQIFGVSFRLFDESEVKKLSVLSITNPTTFDPLGHPIDNGLADTALGPLKRNDFCKTCGLTDQQCLGHFGHISLPLPVFNPIFINQLQMLLRMVCFNCHHFLLPRYQVEIYIAKLKALNLGLDYILDSIEEYAKNLSDAYSGFEWNSTEGETFLRGKLNEMVNSEFKELDSFKAYCKDGKSMEAAQLEYIKVMNSKNVIEKKQHLFKKFLTGNFIKPSKSCVQCHSKKIGINMVNKSSMILSASRAAASVRKLKKTTDEDGEKDTSELSIEMKGKCYLTPAQVREHLRQVWVNEKSTLVCILPFIDMDLEELKLDDNKCPMDVFFWETILVPPNRFRPLRFTNGRTFEHPATTALSEIMLLNQSVAIALKTAKKSSSGDTIARFHYNWQRLQTLCNRLYDSQMDHLPDNKAVGVKQVLEKKEGLLRKHMMGKRVNFAARSVISPDPHIMVDEIGVPVIFATRLSYPQPVTSWNVARLQQMVINGPNKWPGALSVLFEDGFLVRLNPDDIEQRRSVAATLHAASFGSSGALNPVKVVNRHLISGDVMLLNRQPTLHKPSIMAHKARVLPKEKTLRLHYANCKCYNADFDGDEMNAHFPQSELARGEAYEIASVNKQFLIPKDGSPLSGLIQDHIVAGVMLSVRGRFFNKRDYQALVYGALYFLGKPIKFLPPTILRPELLWSGKQIISTIVINLVPAGKTPPSFEIEAKISAKWLTVAKPREWLAGGTPFRSPTDMCESLIIFRHGHLLSGIMDKVSFGANKNGLIHVCYELYGGDVHTKLLTAFARLSTNFLQNFSGFTLGIKDILVRSKPNQKRRNLIAGNPAIGKKAVVDAFGLANEFPDPQDIPEDLVHDKLAFAHTSQNSFYMKQLDAAYKQQTDSLANEISSTCLPKGLVKPFPGNNLQMMIQAGAKGGSVNAIQISCLLGQIELEGRRIPLMMSGRTLPSFQPYDIQPRAGGFVTGRFLTGIRPQEFFFHCMAGREGLIDTAVKTSRSGYLQRCLIKHLEGLVVNYDLTVRDSEGSVVQWLYGEDGIDVIKSQSLKKEFFPTLVHNEKLFRPSEEELSKLASACDDRLKAEMKKVKKGLDDDNLMAFDHFEKDAKQKQAEPVAADELKKAWYELDEDAKLAYKSKSLVKNDTIISRFRPDVNVGAISESLDKVVKDYLASGSLGSIGIKPKDFRSIINVRYMKALANPGEAVGLLAAQSIGEPSTQMTLNTFHFAGRGEMNVTLGVPRLRELLMTASSNISTPSMDIPVRTDLTMDADEIEAEAEQIRLKLNTVHLKDVLEYVDIIENVEVSESELHARYRVYRIRFQFLPKSYYKRRYFTKPAKILQFMEFTFIKQLLTALNARIRLLAKSAGLFDTKSIGRGTVRKTQDVDEEEATMAANNDNNGGGAEDDADKLVFVDDDDDEDLHDEDLDLDVGEGDTTAMKHRSRLNQEQEYEEPDEEEIEKGDDELGEDSQDEDTGKEGKGKSLLANVKVKEELDEDNVEIPLEAVAPMLPPTQDDSTGKGLSPAQIEARKKHVLGQSGAIIDYDFDHEKQLWCEVSLRFELMSTKLDLRSLIEDEAGRASIYKVGKIERAFLVKDNDAAKSGAKFAQMIKTEGVSLSSVVQYENILDLRRIYTNDMHAIANTLGIEAARTALIREITNVFSVYGISVDRRHLSLIADHMTFTGVIRGMNRGAMDGISPLQAMTFETTTTFLKNALLLNLHDDLQSPSSRLVIGRPTVVGTGLFDTRLNPTMVAELKKQNQSILGDSLLHSMDSSMLLASPAKRLSPKAFKRSLAGASPTPSVASADTDAASVASDETGDSRFKMFSNLAELAAEEQPSKAKRIKIEFDD